MNIRKQLLVSYLALTSLGITTVGGYSLWVFRDYVSRSMAADLAARVSVLDEVAAEALSTGSARRAQEILERSGLQPQVNIRLIDPKGRLMASAALARDRQLSDWSEVAGVAEALKGSPASGVAHGIFPPIREHRYYALPVYREGRFLGVLRMSVTLAEFNKQWRRLLSTLLIALMAALLLCGAASLWLARSLSGPIQAMRNFAVSIGKGQFRERLEVRREDELGQLAFELNRMSQQLDALDTERRAFLANVAHELRTPVSNVAVTLDALVSGADQEPEVRERFFQSAQDETARLSKLIQDLLELGRLEAGVVTLECQPLEVGRSLDRAVAALETRFLSRGLCVARELPPVQVLADPERLCQVFMNLLENAVKHARPGSEIRLVTEVVGDRAAVHIHNEGSEINQDDLARVFDRFFVADPARAGKGTGLGLAIARRLTEAHGGSITADSRPEAGTTFTVHLPLAEPGDPDPPDGEGDSSPVHTPGEGTVVPVG